MKYYRNKYLIRLENEREYPVAILDNISDFAAWMNISRSNATMILNNLFRKKIDYIKSEGKKLFAYFIEWSDEEYELKKIEN